MFRKALAGIALLLLVFHGWLFAGQVWEGQLADFALASRWLIAAGLMFGLWTLKRQGASVVRGRRAVALWVLAALLHGPAIAARFDASGQALPEVVAVLVQATTGVAALGGLLVLLALVLRLRRRTPPALARLAVQTSIPAGPLWPGVTFAFAPRPPPIH